MGLKSMLQLLARSALTLALCCGSVASGAPAPWYWWISRHDGRQVCAQFMPAKGWERGPGPFDNAQCRSARRALLHGR